MFLCNTCYNQLCNSHSFRKQCISSVEHLRKIRAAATDIKTETWPELTDDANDVRDPPFIFLERQQSALTHTHFLYAFQFGEHSVFIDEPSHFSESDHLDEPTNDQQSDEEDKPNIPVTRSCSVVHSLETAPAPDVKRKIKEEKPADKPKAAKSKAKEKPQPKVEKVDNDEDTDDEPLAALAADTKPAIPRPKGKSKRDYEREQRKLAKLAEPKKPTKKQLLKEEREKRKLERLEKQKEPRQRKKGKPEQCEVCGFISRSLRMHMLTHTQERNFECDFCGKKFTLR